MKPLLYALLAAAIATASASAQSLSVGSTSTNCGSNVSVPVTIGSVNGLLAVEFRVSYNTSMLTLNGVNAGSLTSGFSLSHNATGGSVRVAMASGTAVSGSGSVASLQFSVSQSANGAIPLSISGAQVNDHDVNGNSGQITVSCVQAPASAPAYVSPSNRATGLGSPVTLEWNPVANATSYRVRYGTSSSPPAYRTTTTTSMSVTPSQQGTTYYWAVDAINSGGAATGSIWSFTTSGVNCATPAAPQLTGPSKAVTSGTSFHLTWTAPSGATEYALEESSLSTFATPSSTTHASAGVTLTKHYSMESTLYYRVRGRNASSPCNVDGAKSNVVSVTFVPRPALDTSSRVVAVAGSLAGNFGSYFRTALQLHNPAVTAISGKIVFHRQGSSGSSADPSIAYQLAPGATASWSDVVLAFGGGDAIGSLDLVADQGDFPVSVARIYNDGGTSGTTGVAIDALGLSDALLAGERGTLIAPIDPTRARMNIGVRSLLDGATIDFTLRNRTGAAVETTRRTFAATWFEQLGLTTLFSTAVTGDEVVVIEVVSGSAIVYGSITDNKTQDPTVQFAR